MRASIYFARARLVAGLALALGLGLGLPACGDNGKPPATEDASMPIDAAVDAAIDAPPGAIGPCLDRPTDLPRPPTGALPCDMLPPGFTP